MLNSRLAAACCFRKRHVPGGEETFLDDLTRTDVQKCFYKFRLDIKNQADVILEAILAPVKEESPGMASMSRIRSEFAAQMDDNWQEEDLDGVQVYAYEPEDLD